MLNRNRLPLSLTTAPSSCRAGPASSSLCPDSPWRRAGDTSPCTLQVAFLSVALRLFHCRSSGGGRGPLSPEVSSSGQVSQRPQLSPGGSGRAEPQSRGGLSYSRRTGSDLARPSRQHPQMSLSGRRGIQCSKLERGAQGNSQSCVREGGRSALEAGLSSGCGHVASPAPRARLLPLRGVGLPSRFPWG